MTVWLQVAKEVDGAASDVVEVPLEDDNTLLLSSLTSQFARAQGLRYRNEANGVHRAVRCSGDKLHPPDDGWADRVYLVVEKQDDPSPRRPSSREAHSSYSGSSSQKRSRDDRDRHTYDDTRKRSRGDNCFRCGGQGHIAHMCTSPWDSKDDATAQECYLCHGRGHMKHNCPNNIPKGVCYKCSQYGHQGRDCPGSRGIAGGVQSAGGVVTGGVDYAAVAAAAGGYAASYDAYGNVLPAYGAQPLGQSLGLVGGSSAPPPMSSSSYGGGSSSYSSTRLCYRCQQPGHTAMQCPKTREQGLSIDSCFKCGLEGHRAKDCNVCLICKRPGHMAAACPSRR